MSNLKRKPSESPVQDPLETNLKKSKLSVMSAILANDIMENNVTCKNLDWQKSDFLDIDSIDKMKPAIVADEMFPEGAGPYMDMEEAGGSSGLLMDLSANEKAVHAEFFNDFEDLYDDDDLQ